MFLKTRWGAKQYFDAYIQVSIKVNICPFKYLSLTCVKNKIPMSFCLPFGNMSYINVTYSHLLCF